MLNIYLYHNNPTQLLGSHDQTHLLPFETVRELLAEKDFSEYPEDKLLAKLLSSPKECYNYAMNSWVPFKKGEPSIATDGYLSVLYAKNVLEGPFKKGERAISKDAENSVLYVQHVLHKPFPLGEPAIKKSEWVSGYNKILKKYGYPPIAEE